MKNHFTFSWLVVFVGVAALSSALYTQIAWNWYPCPLCILQRYGYLLSAVLVLLALFVASLFRSVAGLLAVLATLVALAGAGVAGYHVWVLANPHQTCGVDPVQTILNGLPWVGLWPDFFEADGFCTEPYPPLLGLPLPAWSGIGLLVQAFFAFLAAQRLLTHESRFSQRRFNG